MFFSGSQVISIVSFSCFAGMFMNVHAFLLFKCFLVLHRQYSLRISGLPVHPDAG